MILVGVLPALLLKLLGRALGRGELPEAAELERDLGALASFAVYGCRNGLRNSRGCVALDALKD